MTVNAKNSLKFFGASASSNGKLVDAFVGSAARFVTGDVRLSLFKGNCEVKGVRSTYSIYSQGMAEPSTEGDEFTHQAVQGFVDTIKQPLRSETRTHNRVDSNRMDSA